MPSPSPMAGRASPAGRWRWPCTATGLMHATMAIFQPGATACRSCPRRRRADGRAAPPSLGRLDPHIGRHGRPRARLYQVGQSSRPRFRRRWNRGEGLPDRDHRAAGAVYVALDAPSRKCRSSRIHLPALTRFPAAAPADPAREAVADVAQALATARRPLLMIGRVSAARADWDQRVRLAERLGARVLTDIKTGASFPTLHTLHPFPPSLYVTDEAGALIREADAILSLDWIDFAGPCGKPARDSGHRRSCSSARSTSSHNGWSMDYQALPATDITDAGLAGPARGCAAGFFASARPGAPPTQRPRAGRRPRRTSCVDGRFPSLTWRGRSRRRARRAQSPISACRSAGRALLPLRGSARLHRLRRRRRDRLRPWHGRRRRIGPARHRPPARRGARRRRLSDGADGAVDGGALPHSRSSSSFPTMSRSSTTSCIRNASPACAAGRSRIAGSACGWTIRRSTSRSSRAARALRPTGRCATSAPEAALADAIRDVKGGQPASSTSASRPNIRARSRPPAAPPPDDNERARNERATTAWRNAMKSIACWRVGTTLAAATATTHAEEIAVGNYGVSANGMPFGVAMDKGYFKDEGINVTGLISLRRRRHVAAQHARAAACPMARSIPASSWRPSCGRRPEIISDNVLTVAEFVWAVKPIRRSSRSRTSRARNRLHQSALDEPGARGCCCRRAATAEPTPSS